MTLDTTTPKINTYYSNNYYARTLINTHTGNIHIGLQQRIKTHFIIILAINILKESLTDLSPYYTSLPRGYKPAYFQNIIRYLSKPSQSWSWKYMIQIWTKNILLSDMFMASWIQSPKLQCRGYQVNSQQNDGNSTLGCADTSRLGLQSRWFSKLTNSSWARGYPRYGSAFSDNSGSMGMI